MCAYHARSQTKTQLKYFNLVTLFTCLLHQQGHAGHTYMFHLTSFLKHWNTPQNYHRIREILARRRSGCHPPRTVSCVLKLIPTAAANYEWETNRPLFQWLQQTLLYAECSDCTCVEGTLMHQLVCKCPCFSGYVTATVLTCILNPV